MIPRRKRGGGSKTPEGKAVSSANAKKHGLSLQQASDPSELELISTFFQELNDYYKPESPLERMLERVALCRAKLTRLYEYEQNRLALVLERGQISESLDSLILENIDGVSARMALKLSESGHVSLPFKISCDELMKIVHEAESLEREVELDDALEEVMPQLNTLILRLRPIMMDGDPIEEAIDRLLNSLESFLENEGNDAIYFFEDLLTQSLRLRQLEASSALGYAQKRQSDSMEEKPDKTAFKINQIINKFNLIAQRLDRAKELVPQIVRVKDLISKTAALPVEESDRLMRYQISWERRLSSAIGEFLELRSRGSCL